MPQVVWPVVPTRTAAGMLAIARQLDHSQWLDAATLRGQQFRQLAALLAHARHASPWYEARLADLVLESGLDPAAFATLPTLSREELQVDHDAVRCRVVPSDHGAIGAYASSGSTGRPVRVLGTRLHDLWSRALLLRDHLWHGRDFSAKLAVLKTKIKNGTRPNWGAATDGVLNTGPCASMNSVSDVAEQAHWLQGEDPTYLLSHATNLRALARHCLAHGLRLPRLREVRSYGEMLASDLRELCQAAWDTPLTDSYSAAEIGIIALQCPLNDHYHVQSEHVLVEILDAADRACAAGEWGRVVVTPLHNFAMPLVRYELGDYAEVGAPCACGRGLPVLNRILGRRRNMLRVPDGSLHWPSLPARIWDWASPIRQFQVVQTTLTTITVRLVAERPLTQNEEDALGRRLDERLGWPFTYRFEYPQTIAAGPGFEDFQCLIDDDR
ncbi:MAG: phenylacetate--CoA ligase family protein [Gammaproteobacteria bacterium]